MRRRNTKTNTVYKDNVAILTTRKWCKEGGFDSEVAKNENAILAA